MSFRFLRKADRRQELDREQWADLDRIVFNQELRGQGQHLLEEPVYFGRAYDSPPFFTYSAVGSVTSTSTEVKAIGYPGVGIEGGGRSYANFDPGFERQLAEVGGGPGGNEIPRLSLTNTLEWSDASTAPNDMWGAYQTRSSIEYDWTVSTANPETGTHHLRTNAQDLSTPSHKKPKTLYVYSSGQVLGTDYSVIVKPGDQVAFGVSAMVSNNYYAGHAFEISLGLTYFTSGWTYVGWEELWPYFTLTDSYNQYERVITVQDSYGGQVPAYALLTLGWSVGGTVGVDEPLLTIDVDNLWIGSASNAGADSLQGQGLVIDPSFEVAGRFSTYIPHLFDAYTYYYYQHLYYGDRQVVIPNHTNNESPEQMNFWVQGDTYYPPSLIYGSNILKDPNFLIPFETGEEEIPSIAVNPVPIAGQPQWYKKVDPSDAWSSGMTTHYRHAWLADESYFEYDLEWRIFVTDVNPPTSGKHLRRACGADVAGGTTYYNAGVELEANGFIAPIGIAEHWPGDYGVSQVTFFTGRVNPGDYVKWSCKSMAATLASSPDIQMWIMFFREDHTVINFASPWELTENYINTPLTTSYVTYSVDAVAPADAYYFTTYVVHVDNTRLTSLVWVDFADFVCEVQAWSGSTPDTVIPELPVWSMTDQEAAPPRSGGRQGNYSATSQFDSRGETRWLAPTQVQGSPYYWQTRFDDGEDKWWGEFTSYKYDVNPPDNTRQDRPGGWMNIALNPRNDKTTYEFRVKADGPCTAEIQVIHWDYGGTTEDKWSWWDDGIHAGRFHKEDNFTHLLSGGGWETVRVDIPKAKWWPGYPVAEDILNGTGNLEYAEWGNYGRFIRATVKVRFTGGVDGDNIYFDEAYMWQDLTTQGEVPLITIGVAEWVQDEQGMYVGARLWYRTGIA